MDPSRASISRVASSPRARDEDCALSGLLPAAPRSPSDRSFSHPASALASFVRTNCSIFDHLRSSDGVKCELRDARTNEKTLARDSGVSVFFSWFVEALRVRNDAKISVREYARREIGRRRRTNTIYVFTYTDNPRGGTYLNTGFLFTRKSCALY